MKEYEYLTGEDVAEMESVVASFTHLTNSQFADVVRDMEQRKPIIRHSTFWTEAVRRDLDMRILMKDMAQV